MTVRPACPRLAPAAFAGAALAIAAALLPGAVRAEDPGPLRITVHPRSFEAGPSGADRLEAKVARRFRESEFMFRSICRGCLTRDAERTVFGMQTNGISFPVADETPTASITPAP